MGQNTETLMKKIETFFSLNPDDYLRVEDAAERFNATPSTVVRTYQRERALRDLSFEKVSVLVAKRDSFFVDPKDAKIAELEARLARLEELNNTLFVRNG